MKNTLLITTILLIALLQTHERRILKKKKLEPVTACIGLAILTGFEIANLYKIRSLRKNIKKLSLIQMKENLEHQKTVQRTIGYCKTAQVAYEQKLNQIIKLQKVIIEFKAANSTISKSTASTSCAMPNRDPNREIQKKIIEHAETIKKMQRIYGNENDSSHKPSDIQDQNKLIEDDEHQMICMISLVENNFKSFKQNAIAIAEADLNEMCDVDILKNISEFQKRSAARMKEIRTLESELKKSSNVIYKLFMNKSYEGMSRELNYIAAIDSQKMNGIRTKEIHGHDSKHVNDWKNVKEGLIILSKRLLRFAAEAVMIHYGEEILDATHFVSDKISGLEEAAAIINDFNRGNGVTIAKKADLEKEPEMIGSDIGKLMGLKKNNEVAEKVGDFFNHKNIASFIKKSYAGLFEKEVTNSFLPDIWNRNYFRKLEIRKQFMIDFQVVKMKHLAEEFTKTLKEYMKEAKNKSDVRSMLKPEHFDGYNNFTDSLLKYQMLNGNTEAKQKLSHFFYDPRTVFGAREVVSLIKRGYEIISIHKSGEQAKEEVKINNYEMNIGSPNINSSNSNFANCRIFLNKDDMLIDTSRGYATSKYFFFMGSRVKPENQTSKVFVYSKIFNNSSLTFSQEELEENFKELLTSKVKLEVDKELDTFYTKNCPKSDSTIPLVNFIEATELKIKVIYDNFLVYLMIDEELYKTEFNSFANCFNKYKTESKNYDESVDAFQENPLLNYTNNEVSFNSPKGKISLKLSELGYYYFDGTDSFSNEETKEIQRFIRSIYKNSFPDINTNLSNYKFNFIFKPYEVHFRVTDDVYPIKSIDKICQEYNEAETSLVSDLSDVITEDSSVDGKKLIHNIKAKNGEVSNFRLVPKGGLISSFDLNDLLHKQLMLSFKSNKEKRYIFITDYLLIKEKKVYDYPEEDVEPQATLISISKPEPRQIFSTFYSKYDICRKIQGKITLTHRGQEMETFFSNETYKKKDEHILEKYLANMNRQMQNFSVKKSFKLSNLLNFKIEQELGYYQASKLKVDEKLDWKPCFYASWSAKIEFESLPKFKFKIFKSGFNIEIGIQEDKENGLKIDPHVVIVSTLINGEKEAIEDPTKSEIRKYKTIKSSERKYIHCNYKKLEGENGEVSDIKINLKEEMYLLLSFWVKQNDSDFNEVYEENCKASASHDE